jgi:aspartate ammonia-lyase
MRDNTNSSLSAEVAKKINANISLGIQYDSWLSSLPSRINPVINELDQRVSFSIIYKR